MQTVSLKVIHCSLVLLVSFLLLLLFGRSYSIAMPNDPSKLHYCICWGNEHRETSVRKSENKIDRHSLISSHLISSRASRKPITRKDHLVEQNWNLSPSAFMSRAANNFVLFYFKSEINCKKCGVRGEGLPTPGIKPTDTEGRDARNNNKNPYRPR